MGSEEKRKNPSCDNETYKTKDFKKQQTDESKETEADEGLEEGTLVFFILHVHINLHSHLCKFVVFNKSQKV